MTGHFRIGILGGMGPEAGVLLQNLIIRETPAEKDQDHLEVITYTNPHVPDRTRSLERDGGESYLKVVVESLKLLEKTGPGVLVMACNTAHARITDIQAAIETPIINIVELAGREIAATNGPVGILATDGTLKSGLFNPVEGSEKIVTPPPDLQSEVMTVIHDIKKGMESGIVIRRLEEAATEMKQSGCEKLVLGCTELSIYYDELTDRLGNIFIDPLRLAARKLVVLAKKKA